MAESTVDLSRMTPDEILSYAAGLRAKMRPREAKVCSICGTTFQGLNTQRFCSDSCRLKAHRANQPLVVKVCPVCGTETYGQRRNAVYCSKACREKARRDFLAAHPEAATRPCLTRRSRLLR